MTKIGWWSLEPTRRERKAKNYLKSDFEKNLIMPFKKPDSRVSIGRKSASTSRNRQRLPLLKKLKFLKFRSVEKQDGPIESGRGSPNFSGKTQFLKNKKI